jgi:hypothetical protein
MRIRSSGNENRDVLTIFDTPVQQTLYKYAGMSHIEKLRKKGTVPL